MNQLLAVIAVWPLLGFVLSLLPGHRQEKAIFAAAIGTVIVHFGLLIVWLVFWAAQGFAHAYWKGFDLYATRSAHFTIDFYFDTYTAVYLLVTVLLTFVIMMFSRYYIHREKGYKRFFNNILFFYFGLTMVLIAGNLETLLIGWEFIGVTSFFLIAFYRDRYLPVKNALKVVSLYRIADIFMLLGIWLYHHYFEHNVSFFELHNLMPKGEPLVHDHFFAVGIPAAFLVAALVKSAQLPFSSWLPRAMEGPTSSSAIFYSSLSVHIGVFLLIRTYPLWQEQAWFEYALIVIGLATSIVTTLIARVQSTVKTQIAYSSIAQIGLMMVEVALGWHTFALIHFAGNAFLRTYQLLVSPSVLSYMIHDQFFHFSPPQHHLRPGFWNRVYWSIFVLSIREWNLDSIMYRLLWMPLKRLGNSLNFMTARYAVYVFLPLYILGLAGVVFSLAMPGVLLAWMPVLLALISLLMVIKAFVKREEAHNAWVLVIVSQLFLALAIAYNGQFDPVQMIMFYSGILVSGALGFLVFYYLRKAKESLSLKRFQGHSYERPRLSVVFLIASLGLIGFPITPTFIGEDLMLGHIHKNQYLLTFLIALTLIVAGLAVLRIYARLFLGPHQETYHEIAYRSS